MIFEEEYLKGKGKEYSYGELDLKENIWIEIGKGKEFNSYGVLEYGWIFKWKRKSIWLW